MYARAHMCACLPSESFPLPPHFIANPRFSPSKAANSPTVTIPLVHPIFCYQLPCLSCLLTLRKCSSHPIFLISFPSIPYSNKPPLTSPLPLLASSYSLFPSPLLPQSFIHFFLPSLPPPNPSPSVTSLPPFRPLPSPPLPSPPPSPPLPQVRR